MSEVKTKSKNGFAKLICFLCAAVLALGLLSYGVFSIFNRENLKLQNVTIANFYADSETPVNSNLGGTGYFEGGGKNNGTTTAEVGEVLNLVASPAEGYKFMGFFKDASFTEVISYDLNCAYVVEQGVNKLYAKFAKLFEVTFEFKDVDQRDFSVTKYYPYGTTYGQEEILSIIENAAGTSTANLYANKIAKLTTKESETEVQKTNMNFTVSSGKVVFGITPSGLDDTGLLGGGSELYPYMISNITEMATFRDLVNSIHSNICGKLTNDIALTEAWVPMGNTQANAKFIYYGVFDGGGFTISGLSRSTGGDYNGLFGKTVNATIRNLTVAGGVTQSAAKSYNAGIVGYAENTLIENCVNKANVTTAGPSTGGIVGYAVNSKIINCSNEAVVKTSAAVNNLGGVVGDAITNTLIQNCFNKGTSSCTGTYGGGVVGYASTNVEIRDCYNIGVVNGATAIGGVVGGTITNVSIYNCSNRIAITSTATQYGGVLGQAGNTTYVYNCYNTGAISNTGQVHNVGGIVGYVNGNNTYCYIYNCYNVGKIASTTNYQNIGGICGAYGTISNCYNTGEIASNGQFVGGIVGRYGVAQNCYNGGFITSGTTNDGSINGGEGTMYYCYNSHEKYKFGTNARHCSNLKHVGTTTELMTETGYQETDLIKCLNGWFDGNNKPVLTPWYVAESFNNGYPIFRTQTYVGNNFMVSFNANGGECFNEIYYYNVTESVYGPLPHATKEGYIFDGWFTDETLTHQVFAASDLIKKENHTLYAKWNQDKGLGLASGIQGEGTTASPYLIETPFQLYHFNRLVNNGHTDIDAKLVADINMEAYPLWQPMGTTAYNDTHLLNAQSIGYTGVFDGGNHIISHLNIMTTVQYQGFFGVVSNTTIKNLTLQGGVFASAAYCGGFAGVAKGVTFENCHNEMHIMSSAIRLGGIVGYVYAPTLDPSKNNLFKNCSNSGSIVQMSSVDTTAGIAGFVKNTNFENCFNTGWIMSPGHYNGGICGWAENNCSFDACYNTAYLEQYSTYNHFGGILGYGKTNINISNCYNTGDIYTYGAYIAGIVSYVTATANISNCYNTGNMTTSAINAEKYASGIVGYAAALTTINKCYNTGTLSVGGRSGGIAGYILANTSSITDCYNTADITSQYYDIAGIAGRSDNAAITNCYNTGNITSTSNDVGGIVGYGYNNNTIITNCYNLGNITSNQYYAGGISGVYGTVYNCFNMGNIRATRGDANYVAGISGRYSVMNNCYNSGSIYAAHSYLAGIGLEGTANNCYNSGTFNITTNKFDIASTSNSCSVFTHTAGTTTNTLTTATFETTSLLTALNAWVSANGSTYGAKSWATDVNINNGYPYITTAYFAVIFNANGGTCDVPSKVYHTIETEYGTLPTPLAPYGYTFKGWYSSSTGGTKITDTSTLRSKSNHIIYAQYEKNIINITFEYGEGEGTVESIQVTFNSNYANLPTATPPVGKIFKGWYTLEQNGVKVTNSTRMNKTDDHVLYAIYDVMQGDGTPLNPFVLTTEAELISYANWITAGEYQLCAELGTNINLTKDWVPVQNFAGTLDGKGHYISGLMIRSTAEKTGLFGSTKNAIIKNLTVYGNIYQTNAKAYTGGIVGYAYSTNFVNCTNYVSIYSTGQHVGGVVGYGHTACFFDGCKNYAEITGTNAYMGGICGYITSANVAYKNYFTNCVNYGELNQIGTASHTAGVVGICYLTDITGCHNEAYIESGGHYLAGVVSYIENTCNVKDCYNIGYLKQRGNYNHTAGVVGYAYNKVIIRDCYNTGEIYSFGNYGSGICGYARGTVKILNCRNSAHLQSTRVTADTYFAGIVSKFESGTTVTECYNTGNIDAGGRSGGICGYATGGTGSLIDNCYNTGNLTAQFYDLGGICGRTDNVPIRNCYNTGDLTNTSYQVAGIYGFSSNNNTIVTNCYNLGDVSSAQYYAAGIGGAYGTIYNCYNMGNITSTRTTDNFIGGITGRYSIIWNCFNAGTITGAHNYVGGCGGGGVTSHYSYSTATVVNTNSAITTNYPISQTATDNCSIFTHTANSITNTLATAIYSTTVLVNALNAWIAAQTDPELYSSWITNLSYNSGYPHLNIDQTINQFTVLFDVNGGSATTVTATQYAKTATTYGTLPTIIVREGYIFLGWFTDKTGGTEITSTSSFVSKTNHTIYAQWEKAADGNGLPETPYLISNDKSLRAFASWVNNGSLNICGRLTANVVLTSAEWTPIANYVANANLLYGGIFDGNGYTISLNGTTAKNYMALFGATYGAHIYNLNIEGNGIGVQRSAGVVGYAQRSTFINCANHGNLTFTGERSGGIVGFAQYCTFTQCFNAGDVLGNSTGSYIGGVCGYAEYSNFYNCYNKKNVEALGHYLGGVCGYANYCEFEECYNDYRVTMLNTYERAGGIAGHLNYSNARKCYNTGSVTIQSRYVGGCFGTSTTAEIIGCYNTGDVNQTVSGDYYCVGGIIGMADVNTYIYSCFNKGPITVWGYGNGGISGRYGNIYNCYNSGRIHSYRTAANHVGGIIGYEGTVYNSYNCGVLTGAANSYIGGIGGHTNVTCYYSYSTGTMASYPISGGTKTHCSEFIKESYLFWKFPTALSTPLFITQDILNALNAYADIQVDRDKYYPWYRDTNTNDGNISLRLTSGLDFEVIFNSNGGDCRFTEFSYDENEAAYHYLPKPEPRENYLFDGWYTAKEGGIKVTSTSPLVSTTEHILYAQYLPLPGDGSTENPYLISTAEELGAFRDYVNIGYLKTSAKLMADIDLSMYENWEPIANWGANDIISYQGTFDGNGYRIFNLKILSLHNYNGFIGLARHDAVIKNLGIESGSIYSYAKYTGAIVGGTYSTVASTYTQFYNCYNKINIISEQQYVGGICGYDGAFYNCYNLGNITCTLDYLDNYVGGIVGYTASLVHNSYNGGTITSSYNYAGGITPYAAGKTTYCYSTDTVISVLTTARFVISNSVSACSNIIHEGIINRLVTAQYSSNDLAKALNGWVMAQTTNLRYSLWYYDEDKNDGFPELRMFRGGDFVVTFDSKGGTIANTEVCYADSEDFYGKLPLTTKTGYTFIGWFTDYYGNEILLETTPIAVKSDHTIYAKWFITGTITYTLKFDGVSATSAGTTQVTVTYGVNLPKIIVPIRTGYVFAGYYSGTFGTGIQYYDKSGEGVRVWDQLNAATIYAYWINPDYIITFDEQGATTSGTLTTLATYWQDLDEITIPQKTGFMFAGYFTEPEGKGKQYYTLFGTSANIWDITAHTTLYAYWILDTGNALGCIVIFDFQGGRDGSIACNAVNGESMYAIDIPIREGYVFKGYYSEPNAQGTKYFNEAGACSHPCDFTKNTILYAYWEPMPIVAMNANIESVNVNLFSMNAYQGDISGMNYSYDCQTGIITFNGTVKGNGLVSLVPLSGPTIGSVYSITEYRLGGMLNVLQQANYAGFIFEITDIHGNAVTRNYRETNTFLITSDRLSSSVTLSPITQENINNKETFLKIWYQQSPNSEIKVTNLQVQFKIEEGSIVTAYSPDSKHVEYNTIYGTLPTTSRAGYDFLGWFTEAEAGEEITAKHYRSSLSNGMLFAQYKASNFDVNFYDGDYLLGTITMMYSVGGTLKNWKTLLQENNYLGSVTEYGWKFIGWSTSETNPEIDFLDEQFVVEIGEPGQAVNLYAVYARELYINYNGDEQTSGGVSEHILALAMNSKSKIIEDWSITLRPNGFTKTGYSFVNYALGSPNGTKYNVGDELNSSMALTPAYNAKNFEINLYATWEGNKYTVKYFNASVQVGSSEHTYGIQQKLAKWESFAVDITNWQYGWKFSGWATSGTTYTTIYQDAELVSDLATSGSISLYAVYVRSVTYISGSGANTFETIAEQYWNPYSTSTTNVSTIKAEVPQRIEGWAALGYRTDIKAQTAEFTVTSSKDIRVSVTAFPRLYAVYSRTITIQDLNSSVTQTQYYSSSGLISVINSQR